MHVTDLEDNSNMRATSRVHHESIREIHAGLTMAQQSNFKQQAKGLIDTFICARMPQKQNCVTFLHSWQTEAYLTNQFEIKLTIPFYGAGRMIWYLLVTISIYPDWTLFIGNTLSNKSFVLQVQLHKPNCKKHVKCNLQIMLKLSIALYFKSCTTTPGNLDHVAEHKHGICWMASGCNRMCSHEQIGELSCSWLDCQFLHIFKSNINRKGRWGSIGLRA